MSDHVPQHDPPDDAALVQPEVDERTDSVVVEGDDAEHVLPPTELDPYTPEPDVGGRKPSAALWIGLVVLVALVVFAIVLAVR